ncbi:hypothetical protein [Microvirga massiliensis]|uniref:hypothetical protein n=1 Tax=Microvirga massiliensis TaxID=1033741 RepID=UPI00062B3AF3|nr:hypothetical protein [Microvirga massiliensis]
MPIELKHNGRSYRVYLEPGPELRGRVATLAVWGGLVRERDLTYNSPLRLEVLAMAKRKEQAAQDGTARRAKS